MENVLEDKEFEEKVVTVLPECNSLNDVWSHLGLRGVDGYYRKIKKVIEKYNLSLTWFVDSGRGTSDYYIYTKLYQLMKQTQYPDLLPSLYFKGLYNKGAIPEGFRFLYALFSCPDKDGYDKWKTFSAVYDTGWGTQWRLSAINLEKLCCINNIKIAWCSRPFTKSGLMIMVSWNLLFEDLSLRFGHVSQLRKEF